MIHVLGISGGKDSTALWLWALRTGLAPIVPLFCDTGWEADVTYAYLRDLERRLGPLRRAQSPEQFEDRVRRYGTFPSRVRKWCSPELKVEVTAAELLKIRDEFNDDVEVLVGIRADESPSRANALEREWSAEYDCEVWRPLLRWSVEDVIAEHHRAGVPLNPLYLAGANRVGCWPCIHAGKVELRLVGELDPARVTRVAALEEAIGQTMFTLEESRAGGKPRRKVAATIREAVFWARTERGGKRLAVNPPTSGCFRWGICEPPAHEEEAPAPLRRSTRRSLLPPPPVVMPRRRRSGGNDGR